MQQERPRLLVRARKPDSLILSLGIIVGLLGLVVMIGWIINEPFLRQIRKDFAAMQAPTAMAFIVSGLALVSLAFHRIFPAFVLGISLAAASLLISLEYLFGVSLGVEKVLSWLPHLSGQIMGKPSPPTALCFFCAGTSLALMGASVRGAVSRPGAGFLTFLALAISSMAFFGYLTGLSGTYVWGAFIGMAVHTSLGMILLCIGILTARLRRSSSAILDDRWLFVEIGIAMSTATLVLWQALLAADHSAATTKLELVSGDVKTDALLQVESPLRALGRMQRRWERRGGTPFEEWRDDAMAYVYDEDPLEAVEWIDPTFHLRWVARIGDATNLQGLDLATDTRWDVISALKQAQETRRMVLSPTLDLRQGGRGFIAYFPLYVNARFDGYLAGVFRVNELINAVISESGLRDYDVSAYEDGKLIYGSSHIADALLNRSTSVEFYGHSWKFFVAPKAEFAAWGVSSLATLILLLGFLLTAVFVIAVLALQKERRQAAVIDVANDQLRLEITERRQIEERLRESEDILQVRNTQLEAATKAALSDAKAKAEFLANMSHEIRTPLNAIIGMSELLEFESSEDRKREFVETIRGSGDILLSLINDILDFSKIESGQLEMERMPVDLHQCVESAFDVVSAPAARKKLDLLYWIEPSVPAQIIGDVTRLRQIFVNLLSNAVKFTESGEIFVRINKVDADGAGERLRVTVRDTGIGIPLDRQHRLFQAFSQVDSSTTRRFGGTGLGLAICQRLVELMNGRIWVESESEKGTAFHFEIPMEEVPSSAPTIYQRGGTKDLNGLRVLIVDDNETNRWILRSQTATWGMQPRDTSRPKEGLDWITRGDPFDLAILDVHMPEMDGYELAEKLREHRSATELPILILTSMADKSRGDLESIGVTSCLTKPVKVAALFDTITGLILGRRRSARHVLGNEEDGNLSEKCPLRILIAEDNPVNQRVIGLLLEHFGYRDVKFAASGVEALEMVSSGTFDAVLMDVQMPDMDGLEASRQIASLYPHDERPYIIALTADAGEDDRERCISAGMNEYLSKPVRSTRLAEALRAAYACKFGEADLISPND